MVTSVIRRYHMIYLYFMKYIIVRYHNLAPFLRPRTGFRTCLVCVIETAYEVIATSHVGQKRE
jgi:hypothetical protein